MRIPIFEQIDLQLHELENPEALQEALSQTRLGQTPSYIGLGHIPPARHEEVARNVVLAMERLQCGALFPYPLYLVSEHLVNFPELPVSARVEDLPAHFFKKVKRLKNKELSLLHKAAPEAQKLCNLDTPVKLARLQELARGNRRLYELSKELYFYEQLQLSLAITEKKARG